MKSGGGKFLLALCLTLSGAPALWAAQHAARAAHIGCIIEPDEVVDVGSPVVGVIQSIVNRGDAVRKGGVIAVLHNNVERTALSAAQSRAAANAEEKSALANHEFAKQRRVRAEELLRKNFISKQGLDQAIAEDEVARQKLEQAREQRRVLMQEAAHARSRLEERTIRSPINGIVVERFLAAGERVDDKPLVRVVTINPLRVEAIVPSEMFGLIAVGSSARIVPESPRVEPVNATVTLVDRVMDAASGTFRVRLRLANPGGAIPAGLRCKAQFDTPSAAQESGESGKRARARRLKGT
jgi:RND family efflux transporter MFP subunit